MQFQQYLVHPILVLLLEVHPHPSTNYSKASNIILCITQSLVNLEDLEKSKGNAISPFSMSLIAGINQSEMTRRALVLFCITFLEENAKDVFLLSVDDEKGFNVLAKILGPMMDDGSREYQ